MLQSHEKAPTETESIPTIAKMGVPSNRDANLSNFGSIYTEATIIMKGKDKFLNEKRGIPVLTNVESVLENFRTLPSAATAISNMRKVLSTSESSPTEVSDVTINSEDKISKVGNI